MQSFSTGAQMFGAGRPDELTGGRYPSSQETAMAFPRPDYQGMYLQFQGRYPTGALISELLQIHEGKFVVRALVQVGNTTLSTGLAAAYTPEMAEDSARVRALEVLGIYPQLNSIEQTQEVHAELMSPPSTRVVQPETVLQAAPTNRVANSQQNILQASFLEDTVEFSPVPSQKPGRKQRQTADVALSHPEVDGNRPDSYSDYTELPSSSYSSEKTSGRPSRKSAGSTSKGRTMETVAQAPPLDLSDAIAQTTVEMKRLGWTEVQGRNHLQRTYGKRSRQQLTDEELLDFLRYLESQPTVTSEELF
jgi:hypothetical protein